MTTMTMTNATTCRPSFMSVMAASIAEFCAGAREGREIETRYNELCRKSATELEQMGLTRADVARAALTGPHC